jgi:hypothetical protein
MTLDHLCGGLHFTIPDFTRIACLFGHANDKRASDRGSGGGASE